MSGKANKSQVSIKTGRQGEANKLLQQFYEDGELMRVDLALVFRDENQPRSLESVLEGIEKFAELLKWQGILHPPVYRILGDGTYRVVDGERRTTVARRNGDVDILAICKKFSDEDIKKIYELQYSANDPDNNKALSPLEEANWWRNYSDRYFEGNVVLASAEMKVSSTLVFAKLSILKASPEIATFVKEHLNDSTAAADLVSVESKDPALAKAWMADYLSDSLGNKRQSIKNIKKALVAKERGVTVVKPRSGNAQPKPKVAVAPVVLGTDINKREVEKVVIAPSAISAYLLDEKILLKRVSVNDMQGAFLGRAYLSAINNIPFDGSLGAIADLDGEAYQLFYQVLELVINIKGNEKELGKLAKKIASLLELDV